MRRFEDGPQHTADLFPLSAFQAHVHYRLGHHARSLSVDVEPDNEGVASCGGENEDISLTVAVTKGHDGIVVRTQVRALRQGIALNRVEPLTLTDPDDRQDLSFFRNGWQSWSGSSSFARADREPVERRVFFAREVGRNPDGPPLRGPGEFSSDLCMAVASASLGSAIALVYLGTTSQFGGFHVDARPGRSPRIVARLPFGGVPMNAGEVRDGEPLLMLRGDDPLDLLERGARELGLAMNARIPERSTTGWCSWYHYFTKIDERSINGNLKALKVRCREVALDLFQVDDGYQSAIGDWLTTNEKFPGGMGAIARSVDQEGFTPGLWLAPFIARPGSALLADHPDWFIQNARGRPRRALFNPVWSKWNTAKALDLTHPAVQSWLATLFRTLTREWGYRFLKLDFLFAASLPGRRYDPRRTGAEALRTGLEIIRQSVGDDVHLLGCGCPLGPAVGLVDSMRVGTDVSPQWNDTTSRFLTDGYGVVPSTKAALRNIMSRAFMHRRLWQNDPDCILLRDRRGGLNLHEVQALASLAALSGGTMLISDDLTVLGPDRFDIARTAMRINAEVQGTTPVCLDLMTSRYPGLLWAARQGGGGYLAVLNPTEEAEDVAVELAVHAPLRALGSSLRVHDVWSGTDSLLTSASLVLRRIPPHAVRLLRLEAMAVDP